MKYTILLNILNVSIIFLLNLNTNVLSQYTNANYFIINDVQVFFHYMQTQIKNYLQTFANNTVVTNVNSIITQLLTLT
jgi:hypothetical protein